MWVALNVGRSCAAPEKRAKAGADVVRHALAVVTHDRGSTHLQTDL